MNIPVAQYRKIAHPPKRSKYGAKAAYRCRACGCRVEADDDGPLSCPACKARDAIRFASQAEAKHYDLLRFQLARGEISNLRRQVKFCIDWNGVPITSYVADFVYEDANDETVVIDVKGMATPAYRIKKRLVEAQYGIHIVEVAA